MTSLWASSKRSSPHKQSKVFLHLSCLGSGISWGLEVSINAKFSVMSMVPSMSKVPLGMVTAGYYMPRCDSHKPEIKWRSRRHFWTVSSNYLHYRSSEFMLSPHQWMPSYCLPLSTEMLYNQSANSTQQGWMLSVCLDHQELSPTRLRRQSW